MARSSDYSILFILVWVGIIISTIAGWLTHVIVCIQNELWLFLVAGALFAPIGIIHGWGVWFGWWV